MCFEDALVVYLPTKVAETAAEPESYTIQFPFRYQACNDTVCLQSTSFVFSVSLEVVKLSVFGCGFTLDMTTGSAIWRYSERRPRELAVELHAVHTVDNPHKIHGIKPEGASDGTDVHLNPGDVYVHWSRNGFVLSDTVRSAEICGEDAAYRTGKRID